MPDFTEKWPWKNLQPSPGEMCRAGGLCKFWAEKIRRAIGGTIIWISGVRRASYAVQIEFAEDLDFG